MWSKGSVVKRKLNNGRGPWEVIRYAVVFWQT